MGAATLSVVAKEAGMEAVTVAAVHLQVVLRATSTEAAAGEQAVAQPTTEVVAATFQVVAKEAAMGAVTAAAACPSASLRVTATQAAAGEEMAAQPATEAVPTEAAPMKVAGEEAKATKARPTDATALATEEADAQEMATA